MGSITEKNVQDGNVWALGGEMRLTLSIDGKPVVCRSIGAGCYAAAYQSVTHSKRVFLVVSPEDHSKEALILARSQNKSKHLPYMKQHADYVLDSTYRFKVFETRYSKSFDNHEEGERPADMESLMYLNSVSRLNLKSESGAWPIRRKSSHTSDYQVSKSILGALKDIEAACTAMGFSTTEGSAKKWHFDLHGSNFGMRKDSNGEDVLILRDPLVMRDREQRKKQLT